MNTYLEMFGNMIFATYHIYFWKYNGRGKYLDSNCKDPAPFERIFSHTVCKEYALQYASSKRNPLVLTAPLGMAWITVFPTKCAELDNFYVLGPVLTCSISEENIEKRIQAFNTELAVLHNTRMIIPIIKSLPLVPVSSLQQIAIMLHYCVNGETLNIADINYQNQIAALLNAQHEEVTGGWSWQDEQAILHSIQVGDIHYKEKLDVITFMENMISVPVSNPLKHIKYSAVILTALCTRSSVQGGLLYDNAYSLGNFYCQSVEACNTINEVRNVTQTMYDDFIHRVAEYLTQHDFSKPIRNCCEYIHQHLEDELTVSILARRLGYANYYLTSKFKAETGVNIRDYIRTARIGRAQFLLSNSPMDIQQISDTLHFGDRNYFTVAFRKTVGMTPGEYRKKYKLYL